MKRIAIVTLLAGIVATSSGTLGAESAMAGQTQLCRTDTEPCSSVVTHIHFVDPLTLLYAVGAFGVTKDILCEALFSGEVLEVGKPQVVHGSFTYSGPHGAGGPCFEMEKKENCGTIKETSAGGLLKVLRTGTESGQVTGEGFTTLVQCGGLHCVYNWKSLEASLSGKLKEGAGEGVFSFSEATLNKIEGFLCPNTAKLTSSYKSLSGESVYVSKEPPSTLLCATDTQPCAAAYNHVHFVASGSLLLAQLLKLHFKISCTASFLGEVLGLAVPQIVHGNFTFSGCEELEGKEECATGEGEGEKGEVKELSKGGLLRFSGTGSEAGTVTGEGFEVLVECAGLHCVYDWKGLEASLSGKLKEGAGEGVFSFSEATLNKVTGFLCPKTAQLTSRFESLSGEPIYVKE